MSLDSSRAKLANQTTTSPEPTPGNQHEQAGSRRQERTLHSTLGCRAQLLPSGSSGLLSEPQPAEANLRQRNFPVLASRDKLRTHKPGWGMAESLRDRVGPGGSARSGTRRATEVAVGPLFRAS